MRDVMAEEVRPVVREELAGRVLEQIDRLITLTPEALDALYEDLKGSDAVLRQRAYTLLLKYTVGSPLASDAETTDEKNLVINVGMPGPESVEAEVIEMKTCDVCLEEKPEDQFEGNSERCVQCFTEARDRAAKLLDGD